MTLKLENGHLILDQPLPTYFHVGIVVRDLDQAVQSFGQTLGLTFTEPMTFVIPRLEDPTPHQHELRAVFSRQGPPYYELLQAAGDGIFSKRHCDRIHYIGAYVPDVSAKLEELRKADLPVDAVFFDSEGDPFGIITAPGPVGFRFEYVGENARPKIEQWVTTGVFPGVVAD